MIPMTQEVLDNLDVCKPLTLVGMQKNIKKISTHLLTVLTTSVIVRIEQEKRTEKSKSSESVNLSGSD